MKLFMNRNIAKIITPRKIKGDKEDETAKNRAKNKILWRPNLSDRDPKNGFPTTSPIP